MGRRRRQNEMEELAYYAERVMDECPGLSVKIYETGNKNGPYGVKCNSETLGHLDFSRAWMALSGVTLGWLAAKEGMSHGA